ncbi:MAG: putative small lipoprotein YifL [Porticoccus sp.]|jgi:predicted small lipoprotein YifL
MQRYFVSILLTLVATMCLTGCGNKGPLYLPPEPIQILISNSGDPAEKTEAKESEATEKSGN